MAEVRFLGAIRKAAGLTTFGIDAGTVEELLEALRRVMGPAFQEFPALTPFEQVTLRINGARGFPGG